MRPQRSVLQLLHTASDTQVGEVPESGAFTTFLEFTDVLMASSMSPGRPSPVCVPLLTAREGDDCALVAFRRRGKQLGEFVGPWLKRFGAETLVLGGNIAKAYSLWGPALEHAMAAAGTTVEVRLSTLHEDAAMVGAARVLDGEYWLSVDKLLGLM